MEKILIIQTAFLGDVVLATPLIERLTSKYPDAHIDFLLRKGNEGLLVGHPKLNRVWIWDKSQPKYKELPRIISIFRKERYDLVVNCQRFLSSGLLTVFSGARKTIGFDKNPLSFLFSETRTHIIGEGHEVQRNLSLIDDSGASAPRPALYPSQSDFESVPSGKYYCIAPTSVWFTKQLPVHKWVELIDQLPKDSDIFLLGGPKDRDACEDIIKSVKSARVQNMAGQLSLLRSAAWMAGAIMNYVNDSAPLHLASSMNAPVTAFFCSTLPSFGFGPLSDRSLVLEYQGTLACRPCGLHGKKKCPEGHFKCGDIDLGF